MLTGCDYMLALAAYAYEVKAIEIMTDNSYDRLAQTRGEAGTELPGFADCTGQWVHGMDFSLLDKVLEHALAHNDGKMDLHGPAVQAALDHYGVEYDCCIAGYWNCWEDDDDNR